MEGIYVLICKEPGHIQVDVGRETQKGTFTLKDRDHLRELLIDSFDKKEYDQGLLEAVQYVQKTLDENMAKLPHRVR